jgi:hypothetical protein
MIAAVSLGGFCKAVYPAQTQQMSSDVLMQTIMLDPAVSNVDIVVLQSKDFAGFKAIGLKNAVQHTHEKIEGIYLYTNSKELEFFEKMDAKSFRTYSVKKINAASIESVISKILETKEVSQREDYFAPESSFEPEPIVIEQEIQPEVEPEEIKVEIPPKEIIEEPAVEEPAVEEPKLSIEERIRRLGEFGDFDLFKHSLKKDYLVKEIMQENLKYASSLTVMDQIEREIVAIFRDTVSPPEEKFTKIRDLAMRRVSYKDELNNILVSKLSQVMLAIVSSTEETMNRKVNSFKDALAVTSGVKTIYNKDTEILNDLIQKRLEMQVSLHELQMELISLFTAMDKSVKEVIESFDVGLPTENDLINSHLVPVKTLFTPERAVTLSQELLRQLDQGKLKLSVVEEKILNVVKMVFELCEYDASIIEYQQKLIMLLQANRVEDIVVIDTVLKSALRLFVGATETGVSATAITWAGIVSRRNNSLLVDLTGRLKFEEYGIFPESVAEFMENRIQRQFLCVQGTMNTESEVEDFIQEIKQRLNYYPYMHIVVDPAQKSVIDRLSKEALSISYVVNSTSRSISIIKRAVEDLKQENIARKLIMIDPPVSVPQIVESVGVDPMTTKVIVIPDLKKIQVCEFNKVSPHTITEIVEVFEEAFR